MTSKMLPKTSKFISFIETVKPAAGYRNVSWTSSSTRELISNFKISDFKEIFSDPYWNNYPVYTYKNNHPKRHGNTLHTIVRHIINSNPEITMLLQKHSCGLLLKYVIELSPISSRSSLIKRGLYSKDIRVKKISLKFSPMSSAIEAVSSNNRDIRRVAKDRIMNDGSRYIHLLDDERDTWYMMRAFPSFKLSDDEVKERLEAYISKLNFPGYEFPKYQYANMIANLLSRLKDDELFFYFNLVSQSQFEIIKEQFALRIGV